MTGDNELHVQNLGRLRTRVFPEAVIYQRSEDQETFPQPPAPPARVSSVSRLPGASAASSSPPLPIEDAQETTSQALLAEATTLFRNGAYAAAIAKAARVLDDDRCPARAHLHFQAHYLLAQAYANVGEHGKATRCCRQALDFDPLAVHPYYLLAHIAEEQGDFAEARHLLQKVLYLAPSSIATYLELGALYAREHDAVRARKMRGTALELLKALPPDVPVEPYAALTAEELVRYVQKEIEG
jgi:chemotaxis protein methyltransferase CheR